MLVDDYNEFLQSELKDLDYAAGYLTACLEEGDDVFFIGVKQVAQAHGGMQALSRATKLNRESLYGMLSTDGNPLFSSVSIVLKRLGLEIKLQPQGRKKRAA